MYLAHITPCLSSHPHPHHHTHTHTHSYIKTRYTAQSTHENQLIFARNTHTHTHSHTLTHASYKCASLPVLPLPPSHPLVKATKNLIKRQKEEATHQAAKAKQKQYKRCPHPLMCVCVCVCAQRKSKESAHSPASPPLSFLPFSGPLRVY